MNVNDTEILAGMLESEGYEAAKDIRVSGDQGARESGYQDIRDGIILVNTCCVRESAENKAFGFISSLKPIKAQNPDLIVAVCGCIPKEVHIDLKKKFPFVDLIFGPDEKHKLSEFLGLNGCEIKPKREKSVTAYVTIIEGCNNFCSFCIVPYVRGRERSRPAHEIIEEIKELDKSVFKEVVLLGQNVNSYQGLAARPACRQAGGQLLGIANLLQQVHEIDGIERIRFLTSHPRDMSDDIIDAVKDLPKVCEYFHLPLQSGDDEILKAMNRGYTSDYYRRLVERIRNKIPDATVTSDAIAGFPGETEEQFKNTLKLIKELELDLVNTAAYSIRPGTAALKLPGQLPENTKKERLKELMAIVEAAALKRNKGLIGKTLEVLVNENGVGRTRGNKVVKFRSKEDLTGQLINVKVTDAGSWVLAGDIVN